MIAKNLEFFDKNGYNLNLNWNEQQNVWEGNIFFPRVSVGLYENTTIYVIEYNGHDNGGDGYTYPSGEGNISFSWDLTNSFVDEFFMFNFDEDYEIKDTSSLIYTPNDGPICEPLIINRFEKYLVPLLGSSKNTISENDLLEIHVAFKADENSAETTYRRTLIMSYENGYTKYDIARITFYAETIEEDERLKVWNENLGYNLKPEDTIIFKHSDIHEYLPDFKILNEKRKELMLEGHNIYPYIGGYKSILNAIKFFGYDNLNIVEYWRNIDENDSEYWKLYRTYVYSLNNKKTISTKRKPISLDTKKFQKLNNISLVYNINHPDKDYGKRYDEYGLPNVIEDFDKDKRDDFKLTIEEALVKLFTLKKKLNDEFMPGSTKVTDVIGEGNYFGINLIGNNPQISTINHVESKGYVDFTVFPNKYCYITENEDFARYVAEMRNIDIDKTIGDIGDKKIVEISVDEFNDINNSGDISIDELDKRSLKNIISDSIDVSIGSVCNYYEEYYKLSGNKFGDGEKYGLMDIPDPINVYKDIIDDIPSEPFGDSDGEVVPDMIACAKVVLNVVYEDNVNLTSIIEWKVTHSEKKWVSTFGGKLSDYEKIFVQLPYLGKYNVEVSVWDEYNHCCKQYTEDAIIVEPYNIDIRGFYLDARPLPDELKYDLVIPRKYQDDVEKKNKYYFWTQTVGDKIKGIVTNKRNPNDIDALYDICGTIDGEDGYDNIENLNTAPDHRWTSIINSEDDGIDIMKISWIYNDGVDTSYGVDVFNFVCEFTNDGYDEKLMVNESEDLLYNVIKNNVDKMYNWALQEHLYNNDINSTMRNYRPDGSVSFEGPYYKFDVDNILYKVERGYKKYEHLNEEIVNLNPGKHYEYVRYINNLVNIKPLTWILLGFDQSRITGRLINEKYPKWTLTMLGNELETDEDLKKEKIITTHNGLYFTYLFENEGTYKIKLELQDINGNYYEIEKPIVIVDDNANYEMYHTLNDEYAKYLEEKHERKLIYI